MCTALDTCHQATRHLSSLFKTEHSSVTPEDIEKGLLNLLYRGPRLQPNGVAWGPLVEHQANEVLTLTLNFETPELAHPSRWPENAMSMSPLSTPPEILTWTIAQDDDFYLTGIDADLTTLAADQHTSTSTDLKQAIFRLAQQRVNDSRVQIVGQWSIESKSALETKKQKQNPSLLDGLADFGEGC